MVHVKFQDHGTSGFEEGFLKVFAPYGHGGNLGHVTKTISKPEDQWSCKRSPDIWA